MLNFIKSVLELVKMIAYICLGLVVLVIVVAIVHEPEQEAIKETPKKVSVVKRSRLSSNLPRKTK